MRYWNSTDVTENRQHRDSSERVAKSCCTEEIMYNKKRKKHPCHRPMISAVVHQFQVHVRRSLTKVLSCRICRTLSVCLSTGHNAPRVLNFSAVFSAPSCDTHNFLNMPHSLLNPLLNLLLLKGFPC